MARPARPRAASAGPLRLRDELGRSLATLEHRIEAGLGHFTLAPEEVHDIHREMRRLVSGLSVWARLVPAGRRPEVQAAARRLRRLARLVGRVRDRDVTTALLAPAGRGHARTETPGTWEEFLGRLREDTHIGRELLRAFLRTERQGGLFERVRGLIDLEPRPDAARGLSRILAEERRRRQGKVRRAHRKARRDPTSERLHRLRIRIRQWRHLNALEVAAHAAARRPPPPSWQRLQARLGRLHDLDVALATVPEELGRAAPALRLRERRRKLRRSVQKSLEMIAARPERAVPRALLGGGL